MAKDINLRELFMILKKRFWMIVIITLVATGAGYFQNNTKLDLLYQSSSRIIVGANAEYMKTLMVIMRDPIIMEKVVQKLELNRSPERLAGQISIDSIDNSQIGRAHV